MLEEPEAQDNTDSFIQLRTSTTYQEPVMIECVDKVSDSNELLVTSEEESPSELTHLKQSSLLATSDKHHLLS